jgi:MoaA/NifB/PqqE/SkfB family radical SAM enzyme
MCSIWKQKDPTTLSLKHIEHIFSKNDFSFLRSLTLTGGEPTLRSDLPQILGVISEYTPQLEHVLLATNGLTSHRITEHVNDMLEILQTSDNRVNRFDVQVSLDGVGEIHDAMRGVPGAFQRVQATLAQLRPLQNRFPQLNLRLSSVLTPFNISVAESLQDFARQRNIQIHYNPAVLSGVYYDNLESAGNLAFSSHNYETAYKFFEQLSEDEETGLRFYYQDMAQVIQGKPRSRKCMMGVYSFVLESDGKVYPCINCEEICFGSLLTDPFEDVWFGKQANQAREKLYTQCCPNCTSACYPLPVNALEVIQTGWQQFWNRVGL